MAIFTQRTDAGKVTLLTVLGGALLALLVFTASFDTGVQRVSADDVTTSVTVLNTPPQWTVNAQESTESSSTTPTNAGSALSFTGTATDSSGDNYFLLICKTSGAPTANANNKPTCNGGAGNQWAVSATTTSGAQATASTTTLDTFPFDQELNDWYAWVCDAHATLPRCNSTYTQGGGNTSSPFVINHVPVFGLIVNDGPANPGETVTWTATAHDNDTDTVADTVQLFVCKSNDFNGSYCGAGGSWATSTFAASDPATTTTLSIPQQDKTYNAYVYLVDSHGLVATSTYYGFNSSFVVTDVAPTVTAGSIDLNDTNDGGILDLLVPSATTSGFSVTFEVVDDNGCQNASAGDEVVYAGIAVYRSGITQNGCADATNYNSNNCYAATSTNFTTEYSCTQDGGSCGGAGFSQATWTCDFTLWSNADPTDASTQYTAQNWLVSVLVADDNYATSSLTETTAGGNEVGSFNAFNVSTTSINYGGLEPGATTSPLTIPTDLMAQGNIGLDEDIYGDTMCPTWTTADSCDADGYQTANDILVAQQRYATSSTVAYDDAVNSFPLTASTSAYTLTVNVEKATTTTWDPTKNTYWGIAIPTSITTSGNYSGQNTIISVKSDPNFW